MTHLPKKLKKQKNNVQPKKKTPAAKVQVTGKFVGNERGYGFVLHEGGEDVFIPPHCAFGALHGDEVACKLERRQDENSRQSGKIIEITRRAPMVGTFFIEGNQGLVRPVKRKIPYVFLVPPKSIARFGLADGHRVVFSVDKRHRPDERLASCFVTEVLGHVNDPGVDVLTLVLQAGVPYEFSEVVMEEVLEIPSEVSNNEAEGRLDLRDEYIFTIDGDDTKDFDDAVTIEKKEYGYLLGVHIADVAHYVKAKTSMDKEAFRRGNSVYLPDIVLPMLPFELSNGICSLKEGHDRLALSLMMNVSREGRVISHELHESVININKRYTYNQVASIIADDTGLDEYPMLALMNELAVTLTGKRFEAGALDFNVAEPKVILDENGGVISIEPYDRNAASKIIEEFMILANETIAAHYFFLDTPFVYRVHDEPDSEKINQLAEFLRSFGITIKGKTNLHPKSLQTILSDMNNKAGQNIVSKAVLRTMKQARYSPENKGHFGLSLKHYCHFTSPIRRYADLKIHRIIKDIAANKKSDDAKLLESCQKTAAHVSKTARAAETAERETIKLKMAEYMSGKIGEIFEGVISYTAKHGIYVELPSTVEGMVPLHLLHDDYYVYDAGRMCYTGERKGRVYSLGDKVKVKVKNVSVKDRAIDFIFL
jgi:ribonuclease R